MQRRVHHGLDLSLILPCYNEAEHITKSVQRILAVLEASKFSYEVILIDDKSQDDTPKLLEKIRKQYPPLKVLFHKENMGRGATVMDGIKKAHGKVVGFIDIDLEVEPSYLPLFVEEIQTGRADVVVGARKYPYNSLLLNHVVRVALSKGYSKLIQTVLKLPVKDTEAGYKFFNREKILQILPSINDNHWFWDTEIVARSVRNKLKVKELSVLFIRNPNKTSTVKVFSDTFDYVKALYKFKKSLKK